MAASHVEAYIALCEPALPPNLASFLETDHPSVETWDPHLRGRFLLALRDMVTDSRRESSDSLLALTLYDYPVQPSLLKLTLDYLKDRRPLPGEAICSLALGAVRAINLTWKLPGDTSALVGALFDIFIEVVDGFELHSTAPSAGPYRSALAAEIRDLVQSGNSARRSLPLAQREGIARVLATASGTGGTRLALSSRDSLQGYIIQALCHELLNHLSPVEMSSLLAGSSLMEAPRQDH